MKRRPIGSGPTARPGHPVWITGHPCVQDPLGSYGIDAGPATRDREAGITELAAA
jgi:hypothetical protein